MSGGGVASPSPMLWDDDGGEPDDDYGGEGGEGSLIDEDVLLEALAPDGSATLEAMWGLGLCVPTTRPAAAGDLGDLVASGDLGDPEDEPASEDSDDDAGVAAWALTPLMGACGFGAPLPRPPAAGPDGATRGIWLGNALAVGAARAPPRADGGRLESVRLTGHELMEEGKHISFSLEVSLAAGAGFLVRRRFNDFKKLHAALERGFRGMGPPGAVPAVPPLPPSDMFSFLRTPRPEETQKRATQLGAFLDAVVAEPALRDSAELGRFLDVAGRVPLAEEGVPPPLFHLLQARLQERAPTGARFDADGRAARCVGERFALLAQRFEAPADGLPGCGLLLVARAAAPEAADAWLAELLDAVEEVRSAGFPTLVLSRTVLDEGALARFVEA